MNADALTKAEAQRRVRQALDHIQRAQEELGRAQALLSSLIPAMRAWNRLNKLYDAVHAGWYVVAKLRDVKRLDLDGISAPAFLESTRQTGGAT